MDKTNLESALIFAYESSSDRRLTIDRYLDRKSIGEELAIEECFDDLSETEVAELFQKIFN